MSDAEDINVNILLVVYDNDMYIHWFPQGLAYIAAVLEKEGHDVRIYNQDMDHYPDEHLTSYLNTIRIDVVCVGVVGGYYQYKKLLKISDAINKSKNRPIYVIGGHGPSPEPEFFIKKTKADYVVIGEGEETIVELLSAITYNKPLSSIKGIAYQENGKVIVNERRPVIKDIDSIPLPAYHLFPIEYYRLLRLPHAENNDFVMPVLSGRGCPYKCTFCYRMDEGFRPRSNASIINEIEILKGLYGITYIAFSDELLMSSRKRTESLCEAIIKAELDIKWSCNGRLNFADLETLKLMKKAGCVFINYGIESVDDRVLQMMNKSLTVKQIIKGVENTIEVGISPGLNILFGNIGDDIRTLSKAYEFLMDYDDCAQMRTIRPVTPYPGSQLYYDAITKGLLSGCEDFYNKHTNSDLITVNFTDMTDDRIHKCLYDVNTELTSRYFSRKATEAQREAEKLYIEKNMNFRGFRQT